jgi:purine-binding chemotaxis protein CheW
MKPAGIDWERVRSRLRASERALEEALSESPERIQAAYRQRAVRLAKVGEPGQVSAVVPALVFRLARERYAIELEEVSEALPFARCTRAPGSPPHFRGVVNLRGELRAVLDLATLLGLSENGDRDSGFVLMLRRPGREIGLKVDAIEELREIRPEELSVPAEGNYVKGIASGTVMLLNVDAVLAEAFSKEESLTT